MTDQPTDLTADQIHAQVNDARAQAAEPPVAIALGQTQVAAIETAQKQAAGMTDIGPLREFQGLEVILVDALDHLKLLFTRGGAAEEPTPSGG